ncbi:MAG: hypothetical protein ABI864_01440 [Chloroflexota bacterium]
MSHHRLTRAAPIGLLVGAGFLAMPALALAHPLGNFTVNRAIEVIVADAVTIRYIVDMAEIPAFETLQQIDLDGNGTADEHELNTYRDATCESVRRALSVTLDGVPTIPARIEGAEISLPPGAGGLPTLRLECDYASLSTTGDTLHQLIVVDGIDDGHVGWHEATARTIGDAVISASDVPAVSPSAHLTRYPQDQLTSPPDVRSATISFALGSQALDGGGAVAGPGPRQSANDPLAALVGGELSPLVVLLALGVAAGLGALHALSPGHGKTLVAAYVVGTGSDARSAAQIGLFVAIAHTAGVFALGVVTLVASEFLLPERVIAWLSLVSGLVVAGLGLLLMGRQLHRFRALTDADGHGHQHDHDHDHDHSHTPPIKALTWRSAAALGFAGGAVPSASAVIVLLVAISSDRILFGSVLIVAFGIGMAVVLAGLGLLVGRLGAAAAGSTAGWITSRWARRIGQLAPTVAGLVILATGLVFSYIAYRQLF